MIRKLSIGAIAASLLLSGAMVGVSYGGGTAITEPEVIELEVAFCEPLCRTYQFRDIDGELNGQMVSARERLFDVDGNRVGTLHATCVQSFGQRATQNLCTVVHTLKEGPHTQQGSIMAIGNLHFDGNDVFAVTGGAGAYEGVRGSIVFDGDGYHVNLIP
jgi:hypothetical protein